MSIRNGSNGSVSNNSSEVETAVKVLRQPQIGPQVQINAERDDWRMRFVREDPGRSSSAQPSYQNEQTERVKQLTIELQAQSLELERRDEQLARAVAELIVAEQRERDRLAQFLHDDLQQLLVGARYSLLMIKRQIESTGGEHPVDQIMSTLDEALRTSRSLTVEMSPSILFEQGLAAGLRWLARWMGERHGLRVDVAIKGTTGKCREDLAILLYHTVRELLLNVVKHAGVKEARIALSDIGGGRIALMVADDGVGFDPAETSADASGFGLPAIRERLRLVGGTFEVDSAPGRGARLTIISPCLGPLDR